MSRAFITSLFFQYLSMLTLNFYHLFSITPWEFDILFKYFFIELKKKKDRWVVEGRKKSCGVGENKILVMFVQDEVDSDWNLLLCWWDLSSNTSFYKTTRTTTKCGTCIYWSTEWKKMFSKQAPCHQAMWCVSLLVSAFELEKIKLSKLLFEEKGKLAEIKIM